jgi:hypothetical protein
VFNLICLLEYLADISCIKRYVMRRRNAGIMKDLGMVDVGKKFGHPIKFCILHGGTTATK